MADPYAHGTPAGDHHTWIKPQATPCPNCECCTAALCERGREHVFGCWAVTTADAQDMVRDCPCSAETTEGTAAHDAVSGGNAKREEGGRG